MQIKTKHHNEVAAILFPVAGNITYYSNSCCSLDLLRSAARNEKPNTESHVAYHLFCPILFMLQREVFALGHI